MKELIRAQAKALGFDVCRFTSADPAPHRDSFQDWLAAGHHGAMGWMERNAGKRSDPQKVLPGARSFICLGVNYQPPENLAIDRQSGVIANYARYSDYHEILAAKLKALNQFVLETGGRDHASLWYVDTGPVLERDLAQRAGVGFVGKHNNLISREFGNWLFLSEIITTIPFEPDLPEKNRCGNCTKCISSCPTAAILQPFVLDSRRCISYLTIELKGSIPLEFRKAIGSRIYGCDDCLAACPWNRFARESSLMRGHYRYEVVSADLISLLHLNDEEFKIMFAGSPILRTKRRGFLRNVCVALGNIGAEDCLPALLRAAADPEPLIVEHALWAIEQINFRRAPSPIP